MFCFETVYLLKYKPLTTAKDEEVTPNTAPHPADEAKKSRK